MFDTNTGSSGDNATYVLFNDIVVYCIWLGSKLVSSRLIPGVQ